MNERSRLRGIIWDIDGTLCDTLPLNVATFRTIYDRHLPGHALSDEDIVADFGPTEGGTIRKRLPHDWQAMEREFLDEYARHLDADARVFPGIRELLDAARDRGVRQAVVSGKSPRSTRLTLEHFGLASYFDPVEPGSPDGEVKPECFRRVLDAWGLAPETVACVGDTPGDATAANHVGAIAVRAGWSTSPASKPRATDAATQHFATPAAMLRWIAP